MAETIGLKLLVIAQAKDYVIVRNVEDTDYYMLDKRRNFNAETAHGVGDCGTGRDVYDVIRHYVDYFDNKGDNSRHLVTAQQYYDEAKMYSSLATQLGRYLDEINS